MFEVVGQDIISGNMGFIGTDSDRLYRMGAAEKTEDVTVTGNSAVLDNATGKPFKDLHIYGRSEQMTTTGAQLLDFSDLIGKTETKNGATYKINEDQSITVSGTPTEYTSFYLKAMSLKAGSYYFLRNSDDKVFVQLIGAKADMNNGFTLDEDADGIGVYVVFNVASNNTQSFNSTFTPMLNTGSTALPWEPYTGGKPSPSPDYPQEIVSAGEDGSVTVKVTGRNILDMRNSKESVTNGGVTYTRNADYSFTRTGTATEVLGNAWMAGGYLVKPKADLSNVFCVLLKGVKYSIKDCVLLTVSPDGNALVARNENFVPTQDMYITGVRNENFIAGETYNDIVYPAVYIGEKALQYEPYHEPQSMSVTTPNGLPGIPVTSGGNYTNENGQQWICDEVDLGRGVYVQRIGILILDDKSSIRSVSKWDNAHLDVVQPYRVDDVAMIKRKVICDRLPSVEEREAWDLDIEMVGGVWFADETGFYLDFYIKNQRLGTTKDTSPDDATTAVLKWLKDNPLSCKYALATPIETPLTAAEIAAYKSLRSYRGTTIVEAEDKAGISVTYKCNTKAAEKEVNILHADLMAEMEELDENSEIV